MDSSWWIAGSGVLGLVLAAVGWFMKLQSQMDGKMSYREHKEICIETHAAHMSAISELRDLIVKNEKEAREDRHSLRNEVHELATRLAVLTALQEQNHKDRLARV